ncbi:hypothetical protein MCEL_25620 [Mycolicibacterium celeriflavum]|uniref:Uncharacterized protein n=1 Tax=Mycolicibacterium celeriflavum TaxID=1249101 RepID=A0A7I7RID6_MYCCF|nr:hypothetical protein MCEL_25620 [Mycolicibacterium celeriflavum]
MLEMIACAVDRKVDLSQQYADTDDPKLRIRLSGELRLLQAHITQLLKQVKTNLPAPPSRTTQKASQAARTDGGAGGMVRARRDGWGRGRGLVVAGLYAALFERERKECAEIDPRTLPQLNAHSSRPRTVVETGTHSPALLAALEAGDPVTLEGRQLRGRSLPGMPLRRDQRSTGSRSIRTIG